MSSDASVILTTCPTVGAQRVAVAHKETIVVSTGASTLSIPTINPVRALGFVPISAAKAQQSAAKSTVEGVAATGDVDASTEASAYIVTGGDDKALALYFVNGKTVTIVDTHGPVGKKVTHLIVVPTASSSSTTPFSALIAQAPTGRTAYAPNPAGSFATKEAPSVALAEKEDDEEADDNNVKASGLSAKDAYAVAAGRYYPNQVANVVFANKFGEVYVIALLQTPTGIVFGPAPVFLLQHFSIVASMTICGNKKGMNKASEGRFITCDRDAHVRVSRYPAAFDIEQFLWAKHTVLPADATAEQHAAQKPSQVAVSAVVGTDDAKTIYTGDASGRVTQWKSEAGKAQPWSIVSTNEIPEVSEAERKPVNFGGVVGLALVNDEKTLIVARDHYPTIAFMDVAAGSSSPAKEVEVPNKSVVIQLAATADGKSAVALLRDGSLYTVDIATGAMTVLVTDAVSSAASLATVDLYFAWKSVYAENKTRRDEERAAIDQRNKANPNTNNNKKKKNNNKGELLEE